MTTEPAEHPDARSPLAGRDLLGPTREAVRGTLERVANAAASLARADGILMADLAAIEASYERLGRPLLGPAPPPEPRGRLPPSGRVGPPATGRFT